MSDIDTNSSKGLVTIRINGANIKSIVGNKTEVQQKVEKENKKQKTKDTLRNLGKSLFNNASIRISGN